MYLNVNGYKIISGMQKVTSQYRIVVNLQSENNENLKIVVKLFISDSMAQTYVGSQCFSPSLRPGVNGSGCVGLK